MSALETKTVAWVSTRQTTTVTQTILIWMLDVVTQTLETSAPNTMHLVGERYQPDNLGFGPMDWRHFYLPPVPGIHLSLLLSMGLPASSHLTVVTPLYHMLLEVS